MPRLSFAQDAARRAIQEAIVSGFEPEVLARRVAQALMSAIPSDGFRLFAIDPATLLINRLLASSESDGWARAEWLRDYYLRGGAFGYIELPLLMRSGLTAVAIHETQEHSWGYPREMLATLDPAEHRRLFHELRSPSGGALLGCFPADGRWVAALQAYRRESKSPYRASDVAFLRLMAPAIGKGLAAARTRERALAAPGSGSEPEEASGVLVIGGDGKPDLVTPAGELWCQRIRDAESGGAGSLPTAVWAALAQLKSKGATGTSLEVPSSVGPIRLEASPAGSDGSVAIVLTPVRALVPTEAPADWPLTPGERRVVDLVLRGMTNARIGDELFISVNTVEWHLRSAYEKLGVRSRLELLARLFQEHAPPALFARETD